jgi:hypothetical protein
VALLPCGWNSPCRAHIRPAAVTIGCDWQALRVKYWWPSGRCHSLSAHQCPLIGHSCAVREEWRQCRHTSRPGSKLWLKGWVSHTASIRTRYCRVLVGHGISISVQCLGLEGAQVSPSESCRILAPVRQATGNQPPHTFCRRDMHNCLPCQGATATNHRSEARPTSKVGQPKQRTA